MTEEQIVKALECCVFKAKCEECPYEARCWDLSKDAAAIIKRQKAEIERLTEQLNTARADAVREFAVRIKAHTHHLFSGVDVGIIVDELVAQEMTEGENED